MTERKTIYRTKGKAQALPWLLFQGYTSINTKGNAATDEQISEAFEGKYGYEPRIIKRNGGGILAGPVVE